VALSALGFLAAAALVGLRKCKCMKIDRFKRLISILYSLACGALLGDALIHIVPDVYGDAGDDDTKK